MRKARALCAPLGSRHAFLPPCVPCVDLLLPMPVWGVENAGAHHVIGGKRESVWRAGGLCQDDLRGKRIPPSWFIHILTEKALPYLPIRASMRPPIFPKTLNQRSGTAIWLLASHTRKQSGVHRPCGKTGKPEMIAQQVSSLLFSRPPLLLNLR